MARHTQLLERVNRSMLRERLRSIANRRLRERLQTILWIDDGIEAKEVAEKIGRCRQSVAAFVRLFNQGGIERLLQVGRGPGRQSKLTQERRREILHWIRKGPRPLGLSFSNWDCPRLAYYMKKRWNIALSDEQVRRVLHQEGCTLMRPKHKLPRRDPLLHRKKNGIFRGFWVHPKMNVARSFSLKMR